MSLSEQSLQLLSNLIACIAESERKTEMVRQVLAEQSAFEPYTAFKRLDQGRIGKLIIQDVLDFMEDNKIKLNQMEAQYIFKKLDCNRDGLVTYPDFVKSILPREDARLRQQAQLRDSYFIDVDMLLPFEVEWALSRVLEQHLYNFRLISMSQDVLNSRVDFTSLDAFRCIDKLFQGYITLDELHEFTKGEGHLLSADELLAFFRVVDLDEDGHISYSELLEAITLKTNYFDKNSSQDKFRKSELQNQEAIVDELNQYDRHPIIEQYLNQLEEVKIDTKQLEQKLVKSREKERFLQDNLQIKKSKRSSQGVTREIINANYYDEQLTRSRPQIMREFEEGPDGIRHQLGQRKSQIMQQELDLQLSRLIALRVGNFDIGHNENDYLMNESGEKKKQYKERQESFIELGKSRERLEQLEKQLRLSRQQAKAQRQAQQYQQEGNFPKRTQSPQQIQSSESKLGNISKLTLSPTKYYTPKKQRHTFTNNNQKYLNGSQQSVNTSPMKGNEENIFVMALKEQIGFIRDLEELKSKLYYKPDFHPSAVFSLLDVNDRECLSRLDFELVLNDIGLFPKAEQIGLLFSHFCPDTSFLTYDSFLQMVVPQSSKFNDLMISKPSGNLSVSTKALFKQLIKKHLQIEEHLEFLRQKLNRRSHFNLTQAFQTLDTNDYGFITSNGFKQIFKKYGVFTTNREIEGLVKFYNKNDLDKVSYQDFVVELSPKSPIKI